jgi:hypothetical protein
MTDFKDPYADMGSSLALRDQESYRIKDGIGGRGIIDDSLVQQSGLEIFNPSQGQHLMDIIPYPIGENDPMVLLGKMQMGQPTYLCQAAVHTQVGPGNDKYICVAKTLGERCGRCDVMDHISRDPDVDDELVSSLRPSKFPQCLYYIWDRNSENKGVQLFIISAWFMERDLQSRAKQPKVLGSGKIIYANPNAGEQGGRHIKFEVTGQGMSKKFVGHELIVRKQPIPKQILDQARSYPPLDTFLVWPDYNELREVTMLGINEPMDSPTTGAMSHPYELQGHSTPPAEKTCPYDDGSKVLVIGRDFGKYEECKICEERFDCEGLHGGAKVQAATEEENPWHEKETPLPEQHIAPTRPTPVRSTTQLPAEAQVATAAQRPSPISRPTPAQVNKPPLRRNSQ